MNGTVFFYISIINRKSKTGSITCQKKEEGCMCLLVQAQYGMKT